MSIMVRKVSVDSMAKLIELVKCNPCLYDWRDPHYKDIQRQNAIWESIARDMGIKDLKGDDWKKKWRNQRDIYVKKMRKIVCRKGTPEAERAKHWTFMEAMSFLGGLGRTNRVEGESEEEEDGDSNETVPYVEDDVFESLELLTPAFVNPLPIKTEEATTSGDEESRGIKREPEDSDDANRKMIEAVSLSPCIPVPVTEHETHQLLATQKRLKRDAEDLFFESCALRMKKLPEQTRSFLQLQISQLFFNAENPGMAPVPITPLPTLLHAPLQTQAMLQNHTNGHS